MLEVFGPQSKCLMADVRSSDDFESSLFPTCLETVCSSEGTLHVKVGNFSYECKEEGEVISSLTCAFGSFVCPDVSVYCASAEEKKLLPSILSISPSEGKQTDLLVLRGKNFPVRAKVLLGEVEVKIVKQTRDQVVVELGEMGMSKEDRTYNVFLRDDSTGFFATKIQAFTLKKNTQTELITNSVKLMTHDFMSFLFESFLQVLAKVKK